MGKIVILDVVCGYIPLVPMSERENISVASVDTRTKLLKYHNEGNMTNLKNLSYAMSEMYHFILGLPSGLDGFDDIDFDAAFAELAKVQSGEVVAVIHGKWIWDTEDKYQCTNCGNRTRVDEAMNKPLYSFYPYCGAKMD